MASLHDDETRAGLMRSADDTRGHSEGGGRSADVGGAGSGATSGAIGSTAGADAGGGGRDGAHEGIRATSATSLVMSDRRGGPCIRDRRAWARNLRAVRIADSTEQGAGGSSSGAAGPIAGIASSAVHVRAEGPSW